VTLSPAGTKLGDGEELLVIGLGATGYNKDGDLVFPSVLQEVGWLEGPAKGRGFIRG